MTRKVCSIGCLFLCGLFLTLSSEGATAQVDLNGHWNAFGLILDFTQSGSAVTMTYGAMVFTGSVTVDGHLTLCMPSDCSSASIDAQVVGDSIEGLLNQGTLVFPFEAQRCPCFDGNLLDGDGCSATCQIEPCFTCTPEPSLCTPESDGTSCEDGSACTSGETCSSGQCGGGSPVTPCVDLTGRWLIEFTVPDLSETFEMQSDHVQVLDTLQLEGPSAAGTAFYSGTIDPMTGAFDVSAPSGSPLCPTDENQLTGQANASGTQWQGSGFVIAATATNCLDFAFTATATRCGGGLLDPAEECDDGNGADGDGCSSACVIEPCYTCSGEPSVCTPDAPGTPCGVAGSCQADASCNDVPPRSGCRQSTRPRSSLLRIIHRGSRESLSWKWKRGEATSAADFGDPFVDSAQTIALYDESGPSPRVIFSAVAPAGGTCGSKPCWRTTGAGRLVYRDRDGTSGGLVKIAIKPGADGKAKITLKAKGANVTLPALPLTPPLRLQLQSENGACFESYFDTTGVRSNDSQRFRAKGSS